MGKNNIIKAIIIILIFLGTITVQAKSVLSLYDDLYHMNTKPDDNIIFLGDSLTAAYPIDTYFEDLPTINSGRTLATTTTMLENLSETVYPYNPSIVIIQVGIYDIQEGKSQEEVVLGIQKIVAAIKKNRPKARVYVESLYPVNTTMSITKRSSEVIKKINKQLQESYQDHYIDVYSYLVNEEGMLSSKYTDDGLRITENGYAVISLVIRSHLLGYKDHEGNIYNIDIKPDDNIVFLGDSITHFYPLEYYYKDIPVVNSGIEGNRTIDILGKLDELVYQYNPSKVFLTIGINDLKYQAISKEDVVKNIKKIVSEIQKNRPKAKIYVESIYPMNTSMDAKINRTAVEARSMDDVKYINKTLKEDFKGTDVTFIDMYSVLTDEQGILKLDYTKDGVHLTNKGYTKVTSMLLKYVAK